MVALHSGLSSYVTIANPNNWIQTGWRYYEAWSAPKSYVEIQPPSGYINPYQYSVNWGETVEYKIIWASGNIWCAWIGGVQQQCYNIGIAAPYNFYAHSEVHIAPQNQLNVYFSDVYYMDASYSWFQFNQSHWREDAPYYVVDKSHYYEFQNYGP